MTEQVTMSVRSGKLCFRVGMTDNVAVSVRPSETGV